jgi:hypothetical protein
MTNFLVCIISGDREGAGLLSARHGQLIVGECIHTHIPVCTPAPPASSGVSVRGMAYPERVLLAIDAQLMCTVPGHFVYASLAAIDHRKLPAYSEL